MSANLPADWDWRKPNYDVIWEERIRRLERIRQPGFDIKALWDYYAMNPADWIEDFGTTFDPRLPEIGLNAIVPFVLFPRQREYIDWIHERWKKREHGLVEKSRDIGISWLSVGFAVWMFVFKAGTTFGIGSRKEQYVDSLGNMNSLMAKARMFLSLMPPEFQPPGWDEGKHAPYMRLINPSNGSTIIGEAGLQIGRGARCSLYLCDESAFLENPQMVDAALSATANCVIHASTPNGMNPFYQKRVSGRIPVFVFSWQQDPRKDQAWYETMKLKLDPVVLAQEVDRDYGASVSNSFITGKTVAAARQRGPADVMAHGPVMWGLDVARFGDDKSVLIRRQGRVVTDAYVNSKTAITDLVGWAKDIIQRDFEPPAQIAVDTIGLGAGAADILRDIFPKHIVVDVNSSLRVDDGKNYNLRARMWADMRQWLELGASIPSDNDLETELTALRYEYRGSLLLIEAKDEAKKRGIKSPDRADALALTFAYPPKREDRNGPVTQAWQAIDQLAGY